MRSHRLAVRTSPFHGGSRGSIPRGITKSKKASLIAGFFVFNQEENLRCNPLAMLLPR